MFGRRETGAVCGGGRRALTAAVTFAVLPPAGPDHAADVQRLDGPRAARRRAARSRGTYGRELKYR